VPAVRSTTFRCAPDGPSTKCNTAIVPFLAATSPLARGVRARPTGNMRRSHVAERRITCRPGEWVSIDGPATIRVNRRATLIIDAAREAVVDWQPKEGTLRSASSPPPGYGRNAKLIITLRNPQLQQELRDAQA